MTFIDLETPDMHQDYREYTYAVVIHGVNHSVRTHLIIACSIEKLNVLQ